MNLSRSAHSWLLPLLMIAYCLVAAQVQAAPPQLRTCSADQIYPDPPAISIHEGWDEFLDGRVSTLESDSSTGVAFWNFYQAFLLNSGVFASWNTLNAQAHKSKANTLDLLAFRFYSERGSYDGITPPSISLGYYLNSSDYDFKYSPAGFISGNTKAGQFSSLLTVSLNEVFEWEDKDQNGYFNFGDKVWSRNDLSKLVWDQPCSNVIRINETAQSGNNYVFNLTNLVYNPAYSNLSISIRISFGTDSQNNYNDAVFPDPWSQSLILGPRNALISYTISNYDYVNSQSRLGLNFSVVSIRPGLPNLAQFEEKNIDLTGAYGEGGKLPDPTFNNVTNTTDYHRQLHNIIIDEGVIDDSQQDDSWIMWNNYQDVPVVGTNQTKRIEVAVSEVENGTLSIFSNTSSAQHMFIDGAFPNATNDRVADLVSNYSSIRHFFISFPVINPADMTFVLSVGQGVVPVPGELPEEDQTWIYVIVGVSVGLALGCAGVCICYSKKLQARVAGTGSSKNKVNANASAENSFNLLGNGGELSYGALADQETPAAIVAAAAMRQGEAGGAANINPLSDPLLQSPSESAGTHAQQRLISPEEAIRVTSPTTPGQLPAAYSPASGNSSTTGSLEYSKVPNNIL